MLDQIEDTLVVLPVAHNNEIIRFWNDCLVQFPVRELTNQMKVTFFPVNGARVTIRTVGQNDVFEFKDKQTEEIVLECGKQQTVFSAGIHCLNAYHTDFDFDQSPKLVSDSAKGVQANQGTDQQDVGQSADQTPKTRVPRK